MSDNYIQKALALKALSDPNRLVILDFLIDGERCACKILEQLKISQPTLSHHMRILCETNLVHCRKDGKWNYYSLNSDRFRELTDMMEAYSEKFVNENHGECKKSVIVDRPLC